MRGCGATDRGAHRPRGRCAARPRGRRTRSRNTAATAGVSAISGTSTSTFRPVGARLGGHAEVQLRLTAAGHAVQQRHVKRRAGTCARKRANASACSGVSIRLPGGSPRDGAHGLPRPWPPPTRTGRVRCARRAPTPGHGDEALHRFRAGTALLQHAGGEAVGRAVQRQERGDLASCQARESTSSDERPPRACRQRARQAPAPRRSATRHARVRNADALPFMACADVTSPSRSRPRITASRLPRPPRPQRSTGAREAATVRERAQDDSAAHRPAHRYVSARRARPASVIETRRSLSTHANGGMAAAIVSPAPAA